MQKIEKKIFVVLKVFILLLLLLTFKSIFISFFPSNLNNILKVIIFLISDLIVIGILLIVYRKTLIKDFKSYFKDFLNNFEQSFKYYIVGLAIMIISNLIIVVLINNKLANNEESVRLLIELLPIYMIFTVSIFAPITEELIFRKGIREIFDNKYLYIIISGCFFALMHLTSENLSLSSLLYIIPYSSLGITFAYTYYKTNNIFSTIMMHSFHNTVAIILYIVGGLA